MKQYPIFAPGTSFNVRGLAFSFTDGLITTSPFDLLEQDVTVNKRKKEQSLIKFFILQYLKNINIGLNNLIIKVIFHLQE